MIIWPYLVALGVYVVIAAITAVVSMDYPKRKSGDEALAYGLMWPLGVINYFVKVAKVFPAVFRQEYRRGQDF